MKQELENIKIADTSLSDRLKIVLRRGNIYTLKDLLERDYGELSAIRYMGSDRLQELKAWVHSLGYQLMNEEVSIEERVRILKGKGCLLLEDYGFSSDVYLTLYKNHIYTIDDLKKAGNSIYSIDHFGPVRRQKLNDRLIELGLDFNEDSHSLEDEKRNFNMDMTFHDEKMIAERNRNIKKENHEINARIAQKELLLMEYQKLIEERKELLRLEHELDQKLELLLSEMKKERKGKTYVRKQK